MKCIIASHNPHKLEELRRILQPLGMEAVTDRDLGIELPEVEETGTTFEENARLKAVSACEFSGLPAIGDDSGLMVDALGGEPGVYSARYAGENATPRIFSASASVCRASASLKWGTNHRQRGAASANAAADRVETMTQDTCRAVRFFFKNTPTAANTANRGVAYSSAGTATLTVADRVVGWNRKLPSERKVRNAGTVISSAPLPSTAT